MKKDRGPTCAAWASAGMVETCVEREKTCGGGEPMAAASLIALHAGKSSNEKKQLDK